MTKKTNHQGFTLIELMIAMAISVTVMAAAYMTFKNQQDSFIVQENVTTMQQNIRAGVYYLTSDIRMAGFNPGGVLPSPTITAVNNNSITFQRDDGTGSIVTLIYTYNAANRTLDRNFDGANGPMADEIAALGFAYAYDDDEDGQVDTYDADTDDDGVTDTPFTIWAVPGAGGGGNWLRLDSGSPNFPNVPDGTIDEFDAPTPGGIVNEALNTVNTGTSVDPARIKAVKIYLLARTERSDDGYSNNLTYILADQKIAPRNDGDPNNDNCRMRLMENIVMCRNMGGM